MSEMKKTIYFEVSIYLVYSWQKIADDRPEAAVHVGVARKVIRSGHLLVSRAWGHGGVVTIQQLIHVEGVGRFMYFYSP